MKFAVCLHGGAVARGALSLHRDDRRAVALGHALGAQVVAVEAVGQRGSAPLAAHEALAAGATQAVRVVDPVLGAADAPSTAFVLATAMDRFQVDLVLFGTEADPEGAADVPGCIAHHMSAIYLNDVVSMESLGSAPSDPPGEAVIVAVRGGGFIRRLRVPLNAVIGISANGTSASPPPAPAPGPETAAGIHAVEVLSLADLKLDPALLRSRVDRRGVIDAAPRPLVTLQSPAAIAALLRR